MRTLQQPEFPNRPAGIQQDERGDFYLQWRHHARVAVQPPVAMRLVNRFKTANDHTGREYSGGFSAKFSHDSTQLQVLRNGAWVRL